jgi:tetratricopeptide (TPR) repeat protein
MTRKILTVCILALSCFVPVLAAAQSEVGGVENVFSYGVGLRALGMGGAFTAMENDATLAYWNPGAMAFNQYKELSLFGTRLIADSYYFSAFYSNPTTRFGTLSLGGIGAYTNGIESYDENASPIADASTDYLHYQILLSYGYNFKFGLGLGATAKVEQLRITDYKGTGASFDIGTFYRPPKLPWLSLGAVVQDVYGTGIKIADEFEQNTRVYKFGTATNFTLGENKKTRLSFALDGRAFTDNYNPGSHTMLYDFSLGTELSFNDAFMLRAGYKNFSFDTAFQNLPIGLTAGMTVRHWGFGIDYAVGFEDPDWQGTAELFMRLGLTYRFGKSIDEKKQLEAQKIRDEINQGIKEATKEYDQKLSTLSQQYNQEKQKLTQDIDNLNNKVENLTETTGTQQDTIVNLNSQVEEKNRDLQNLNNKYNEDVAALNKQFIDQQNAFQTRISSLEQQSEQEKSALTRNEMYKSEYYARGLQAFSDGRYKDALDAFETVQKVDPNYLKVQEYITRTKAQMIDVTNYSQDILDLYYKGIDLFVQKKYKEAIAEWNKILEKDKYNKLALRSIKEAEDRLSKLKELGIKE